VANINDLYNQLVAANGKLDQLKTDVNNGTAATNHVKTSVDTVDTDVKTLDTDLKAGFAATVNALTVLAQIDTAAVELLFHLTQQADTMICALQQISQNTCGILTQVTIQTQLQTRIRNDANALVNIAETADPAAALELERLAKLRAQIEQCCPPREPEPACTFQPCPSPTPIAMPSLPQIPTPTPPSPPPK
jgi:ABC-type transporter Mla MlaB component